MRRLLLLTPLVRLGDAAVLLLRCTAAAYLFHRSLDKAVSAERMQDFERVLGEAGVVAPQLASPLCVLAMLLCAVSLVLGLLTRWAGLVIAAIFAAALVVGPLPTDVGLWWPSLVMVFLGLLFATAGPGRFSLDAFILAPRSE